MLGRLRLQHHCIVLECKILEKKKKIFFLYLLTLYLSNICSGFSMFGGADDVLAYSDMREEVGAGN